MNAKSKSLFAKLLTIIMIFCCMLGAWFTLPFGEGKTANAATTIDITDTIGLKFESGYSNMTDGADYSAGYTGKDDICLVGYVGDSVLNANSKLSTGQCWVASASASNPTNNGGVNIMEYIYVNGSSISALSAANAAGTTSYKGTHWELGQGGKRAPALVETSSTSGLLIRICMAYSNAGKFEIVITEGFQLLDVNGDTVTVSKDVAFTYENGAVTKADKTTPAESYTLSFESTEGEVDPITVTGGSAIGTLPAVPEKSGYTGVWQVDGAKITAETVYSYGANKTAVAVYTENAGKIDITDAIMFTQDDWMSGSPADCITLSIRIYNEQKTDWLYEYVVADSSIKGYWNDNGESFAPTNGVDIMDYLYFNGESARSIVTKNKNGTTSYTGTTFPLSLGGVYSPIAIETTGSFTKMMILNAWIPASGFTITVKSGFELLLSDGNIITATDDVSFQYANGTIAKVQEYTLSFEGLDETKTVIAGSAIGALPAVPEKSGYKGVWTIDGAEITADTVYSYGADKTAVAVYTGNTEKENVDVTETVSIVGGSYSNAQSQVKIELDSSSALTSNGWWNIYGSKLTTANNDVDIMDYIYINGQNIRTLSDDNRTNNTYPLGEATGWLGNSDQCRPVFVETTADGIYLTVLHAFSGASYTITLKAGFALLNADGNIYTINKDVEFLYTGDSMTKIQEYTLSFEGLDETKTVIVGQAIGALPAVPEQSGRTGVWTIDGVEITADTVYTYDSDKTAVVAYEKIVERVDVTETVSIVGGSYSNAQSQVKIELDSSSALTSNGWWNIYGSKLTTANNDVDIMDYIYINGQNIRTLSDDNRTNNTYPLGEATGWLGNSDQCRPVFVETTADGIFLTVLHAFSGASYTITLKAGFELLNADGDIYTISEDVEFLYDGSTITKIEKYTLSFEGLGDTMIVTTGQAIGELPEFPEIEGKVVTGWMIDGEVITENTIWQYTENKTAACVYLETYTLSFEGLDDTLTVAAGQAIGKLPTVPAKDGYVVIGWEIDGVSIASTTVYTYGENKTATPVYAKDVTDTLAIDYQPGFANAATEVVFVVQADGGYLKTDASVSGVWNSGYTAYQTANGGLDILEYICVNGETVRDASNKNKNGTTSYKGDAGWLANGGAYAPVFVETTNTAGLFIRIYTGYSKEYFEITFKAGFSLINDAGEKVIVTEDVTYKYISGTVENGEITDADLDSLEGQQVTLMNGGETYFDESKRQLTLPALDTIIVAEGLSQVFVGWTTDTAFGAGYQFYPAGYKLIPDSSVTLYAVWLGFEMQDGAAVRLTQGSSGIRFLVDIDKDAYDVGVDVGLILDVGTLVAPTDYLKYVDVFEHSSFAENQYTEASKAALGEDWIWTEPTTEGKPWTYAAAFVNISEAQYSRRLSARGYLKIQYTTGEGYVYTQYNEEVNARSIYEVATLAYEDEDRPDYRTNATILNYINKVADLTWSAEDYSFARTESAYGDYEITSIEIDPATAKATVQISDEVASVLVNGERLSSGNNVNVQLGDYIYNLSDFVFSGDQFTFLIGAANDTYAKNSDETLYFYSSDEDLDFFLNDFFKRHSGYTEDGVNLKVNSVTAGVNSEEFFSQEWMSKAYYWYNSDDGYAEDRIAGLRAFLSSVPVDDYGYVWSSNDKVRPNDATPGSAEQRMGWPYPSNDDIKGISWDFNGSVDSWSSNIGATSSNNLYTANVSGQTADIVFTSPTASSSGFKVNWYTYRKIYTYSAPLLEFDIRIDDVTNVNDILVGYTTSAQSTTQWVSVKENAFLSYDIGNATGEYNHLIFMPMYAFWGESSSTYLKQIQIKIDIKDGKSMSGNVGLNYVRPTIDTRYSNNNSILISSLRQDYDFTGDLTYLQNNITRARKAMNFLMQMYDSSRKLNNQSYLVGHDGDQSDIESSLGNGYWDILFMPEYDFQSNMYFYKALADMAYLEGILASNDITVDKSLATIKTATRAGARSTSEYSYTADALTAVANAVLAAMRETTANNGFWNESTGRFAAGYNSKGALYDYGYVAWNLEAIYYGVATEAQATSIMSWLNSENGLYEYEFAPLSITETGDKKVLNGQYYNNSSIKSNWVNCQYGGAIMYTSFYDLMARINYGGADNAYARLQEIQDWYKTVYDYYVEKGSDPNQFYRYYYESLGIQMQGQGTNGEIGIDAEFLESYLPLSAVAYGFFGIDSIDGKTLQIAPQLPTELSYWGMENLAFNFVEYDLKAYKNGVQITSVRGDTTGLKLQIVLDWKDGDKLYVNGMQSDNYTVENGKVYVTVDMEATVVEIK